MIHRPTTRTIGPPTLRGWYSGRPDRESNPALDLAQRLGVRTEPGLYEVISQQWYRLARWLRAGRQELASVQWRTVPCNASSDSPEGDESPEERRWNSLLDEMLRGGRVGVEQAVPGDVRYGWGEWVGVVHDAYWHGFALVHPYWSSDTASLVTGRIAVQQLLRSSVDRYELSESLRPSRVWYSTSGGYQTLDYERLIHVVPAGVTGQLFGEAALRPMIGPGLAWIQSLVQSGIAEIAESGVTVLHGREAASDDDAERYDAILRASDDGQLRSALLYADEQMERQFPSSSSSGRLDRLRYLDEVCDTFFSRQNASLYSSGAGSRAAAETIGDEDSQLRETTADELVRLAWRTLAEWVASETGYTGRIRDAETVQPEARQAPAELVGALSAARTAGLLRWTEGDEGALREAIGWRPIEEGEVAAAPARPIEEDESLDDVLSLDSIALVDAHPKGCGCGAHRASLRDRPKNEVTGRDGRTISTYAEVGPVEIDGVMHYVDESVAWFAEVEAETAVLDGLTQLLWPQVQEHRAEVASAVRRGASAAELDQLQRRWSARYARSIRIELAKERARQAADASEIARVQTERAPDRVYELTPTPWVLAVRSMLESTLRAARQSAVTIASRVQGEAVRQGTSGLPTRITPEGIAREATGPIRAAGQAQAIESASAAAPEGYGVIAWIRLGYLDDRICEWCESQHRRRWLMRTEREEWLEYVERHGPPDPDCEGTAERCRCRLVPVYGRVSTGA